MTKQKFYEKIVLMTYQNAEYISDDDMKGNPMLRKIYDEAKLFKFEIPETFSEFRLKRAIFGLGDTFPVKQPFDKLGFPYIAQIFGFVINSNDDELKYEYIELLKKYKMLDFTQKKQVKFLVDLYVDMITTDQWIAEKIFSLIFEHIDDCINADKKSVEKFCQLGHAFGVCDCTNYFKLGEILTKVRE